MPDIHLAQRIEASLDRPNGISKRTKDLGKRKADRRIVIDNENLCFDFNHAYLQWGIGFQ
jgi:hypothetical protein